MTNKTENKDTKQKWNHKIINYFTFPICIHICLHIRNLKINLSLDPLCTQSQTPSTCFFQRKIPPKSWHTHFLHFASHFPEQPILIRSSFSLVHWNYSYQGHYPLPNPMSTVWFILLHLSAAFLLFVPWVAEILFSLGFQATTLLYSSFLSDHPSVFPSLNSKYVISYNPINICMLETPKYISPLNSRLIYPTTYSTSLRFLISISNIICHTPNPL